MSRGEPLNSFLWLIFNPKSKRQLHHCQNSASYGPLTLRLVQSQKDTKSFRESESSAQLWTLACIKVDWTISVELKYIIAKDMAVFDHVKRWNNVKICEKIWMRFACKGCHGLCRGAMQSFNRTTYARLHLGLKPRPHANNSSFTEDLATTDFLCKGVTPTLANCPAVFLSYFSLWICYEIQPAVGTPYTAVQNVWTISLARNDQFESGFRLKRLAIYMKTTHKSFLDV